MFSNSMMIHAARCRRRAKYAPTPLEEFRNLWVEEIVRVRNNAECMAREVVRFSSIQRQEQSQSLRKFDDWKTCGSQLATRIRLRLVGRISPSGSGAGASAGFFSLADPSFGEFHGSDEEAGKEAATHQRVRKNSHVGGQPKCHLFSALSHRRASKIKKKIKKK